MSKHHLTARTKHRARLITTADGKFIHLGDCKRAIEDDEFILECLAVLKVGVDKGRPHLEAFRNALGNVLFELSGDVDRYRPEPGGSGQ